MDSKSKIFPWDIKRFGFGSPLKFGFFENRLFSWNERKWCTALFFCPNFMKFGGFEGFGLNFQPNLKKKIWGSKITHFHQLFMFLLSSEMATCRAQDQIFWDILYTVGKILKSSIQWKWSEPGQFIWEAAKSSWSCPFFAISRIFFESS